MANLNLKEFFSHIGIKCGGKRMLKLIQIEI